MGFLWRDSGSVVGPLNAIGCRVGEELGHYEVQRPVAIGKAR
jgi:hypothetical protein